ncbi:MAG: acyltransferase [Polyangiaceae bacterium]
MGLVSPSAERVKDSPRDAQLDGLRGAAILAVVLYHATPVRSSDSLLERAAFALPWMGWAGVDVFFVLSGFLITRILLRERGATNYFAAFYARRVLRIFPLYYLVLAFFLVAVPAADLFASQRGLWLTDARSPLWYVVFLGNGYDGVGGSFHHGVLAITWSLAIEEQFYALWPLVVARVSDRRLETVCLAIAGLALAARGAAVAGGASWILVYVVTPFRVDGLAIGAWLALRSARPGGVEALSRASRVALPVALALVAAFVGVLVVDPGDLVADRRATFLGHPLTQTFGYTALAGMAGSLVAALVGASPSRPLRRVFESRALRDLGRISYALYLFHVPVILAVKAWILDPRDSSLPYPVAQALYWVAVLVVGALASELSWWALESRVLSLRRLVPFRHADLSRS